MNTVRTNTGYQIDKLQVDSKPYSQLPPQQARTLLLAATGLTEKSIAKVMGISPNTVHKTCDRVRFALHSANMREAVHHAMQQGILRYTLAVLLCLLSATDTDLERSYRTVRRNQTVRTRTLRGRRKTDFAIHDFINGELPA